VTHKHYKYGNYTCKFYKKPAGKGFEVGFTYAGHEIFVGNFIHAKEANTWFTLMTKEMHSFARKYTAAPNAPMTWTTKFLKNYFYKAYYSYLDREFTKYQRTFTQALRKDERRHTHFKKTHPHATWPNALKRAA
jgi:hypothetical protein